MHAADLSNGYGHLVRQHCPGYVSMYEFVWLLRAADMMIDGEKRGNGVWD